MTNSTCKLQGSTKLAAWGRKGVLGLWERERGFYYLEVEIVMHFLVKENDFVLITFFNHAAQIPKTEENILQRMFCDETNIAFTYGILRLP